MRLLLTILVILLSILQIDAQAPGNGRPGGRPGGGPPGERGERPAGSGIVGKVMDERNTPIPFANVALYDETGETVISGTTTKESGRFFIKTKPGQYVVKITFLSYEEKVINDVIVDGEAIKPLGPIVLREAGTDLDEVVVQAEKSQMQLKLDKRVFVVGTDLSTTGANAIELLDNVPSLSTDIDGNVSLRGSANVRILIDGKPSALVGGGSSDALRSLQSSTIEKVEVITNPSARYDAEGEVGIVNIVLKKEKKKGFNGSIDVSAGYPEMVGTGINLNFRKEKFNLFTNIGLNYRKSPGKGSTNQTFYRDSLPDLIYSSESDRLRGGYGGNLQLGVDYYLNKLNTITLSGMYRAQRGRNIGTVIYQDFTEDGEVFLETVREDLEEEPSQNFEVALSHTKKYKEKGRKWTTDFKFLGKDDTETNTFTESYSDNREDLAQKADNVEDEQTLILQTDYVHPLGKDHKFELGLKGSLRNIQNDYKVEQLDDNGDWSIFRDLFDELTYKENIYAAYAIYGNKFKKFSYQAGLRAEYSDIQTELKLSNVTNPRSYFNFFPSAHLSYEVNEKNQLQISYSRRLTRPRFWYLLPFVTLTDVRQQWKGNPDLNPEYTNSVELGYLKYFENGSLLTSVYYRYRTDLIERLRLSDSHGNVEMLPVNLGTQNAYGIELSGNYKLTKWWSATGSIDFYQSFTEGNYEGRDYSAENLSMQGRLASKFKFPEKLQLQVTGRFRAPRVTTQGKSLGMYGFDIGLSKEVLKGNGTLTFSVRDILNTRVRRSVIDTPEFYSTGTWQRRARQFTLGLNYRINQDKKRGRGGGFNSGGDDF